MENMILRKSFTVTAWTELIKRASSDGTVDEDAVLALSQIILELKFKEPVRLLKPFLHKISPHISNNICRHVCHCTMSPLSNRMLL